MEGGGVRLRKRLTLSEQMSVLDTSNLRDLLRVRDDDDDGRNSSLVGLTLGAVLGCEEERRNIINNPIQSSRTLLDIIKDEESGAAYRGVTVPNINNNDENKNNSWKSFKDRLLLRRAGAALSSTSSSSQALYTCDYSIDDCRMEISRPSLTSIPSRSSFTIPQTLATNSDSVDTVYTINLPQINAGGIVEEENDHTNSTSNTTVPAPAPATDQPVVMRLAAALEAEREEQRRHTLENHQQEEDGSSNSNVAEGGEVMRTMNESTESILLPTEQHLHQHQQQPLRVSLMALLEETDRQSGFSEPSTLMRTEEEEEEEAEEAEEDERGGGRREEVEVVMAMERGGREECVCCVCMVRHKGAAFIPCGHTFCRICSRKLWVNRGNCPLCNGYILEILDIF